MKVLIVKTSSLGDIIHAFPVISYLHQKFPEVKVDWVVEKKFAELVIAHPLVNKVICIDTNQWRKNFLKYLSDIYAFRKELRAENYDVVFDLQGNSKSGFVLSQVRSDHKVGFGKKSVFEWPNLLFTHHKYDPPLFKNVREETLFLAQSYFQDFTSFKEEKVTLKISEAQSEEIQKILKHVQKEPKVLICPGSAWPNKQLTQESLLSFLRLLQNHLNCHFLLLWGSPEEKVFAQKLNEQFSEESSILNKLPLPVLQNLMAQVDLVVAMDSLPLHLAGTTETRTFSVFGASSANKYKPKGDQHIALQGSCPYGNTFERRCAQLRTCPTGLCIRSLKGEELFQFFLVQFQKI